MRKISVIIPTYNREQHLPIAIRSVLGQKNFSGELLVVDDGSTDATARCVTACTDGRLADSVRYLLQKHAGVAAARNYGVRKARYDLIAFLDSDDQWKSDKLERQDRWLQEHSDFSICHTYERWYRNGQHLNQKKIHIPRHGDIFSHCVQLCAVGMSTVLMKKELFWDCGGFDEALPCCEDFDLWLRIACKHQFLLLPERLTIKDGGRTDQLSFTYRLGMDKFRIYALCKLLCSDSLNEQQRKVAEENLFKRSRIYGQGCRKYGREKEAQWFLQLPERIQQKRIIELDKFFTVSEQN